MQRFLLWLAILSPCSYVRPRLCWTIDAMKEGFVVQHQNQAYHQHQAGLHGMKQGKCLRPLVLRSLSLTRPRANVTPKWSAFQKKTTHCKWVVWNLTKAQNSRTRSNSAELVFATLDACYGACIPAQCPDYAAKAAPWGSGDMWRIYRLG